ncbi:hypothetical protein [Streptomyces antarcticus]|uniref:hypothetical protein n=1 Tax=Streptomyces antarcticus TaxID=2996458 RepID=UPI0022721593|nr:hypothetical protein [Streptomyces sp. H34-AA3]MCY0943477.1 hypothetical protein [Streptomyces sp. H34-AA3]
MKTCAVEFVQLVTYRFEVTAESEEEAEEAAWDFWETVPVAEEYRYYHDADDRYVDSVTLKGDK